MNSEAKSAVLAMPVVLLVAAGLALAGSTGGQRAGSVPVFALCVALAFVIQWVAFVPAYARQTEKYYDLTGGITNIALVALALALSDALDTRAWLLGAMVGVWVLRLASFLFLRIRRAGEDTRFEEIKKSAPRFLITWTLQGMWVSFSQAAALAAITSQTRAPMDALSWLGVGVWLAGFGMEVIADDQKRRFKADPANKGKFISTGLWSLSRHPNYLGEITLWIGVALAALPALRGWQFATLVSPLFIILLLTRVSGVNLLEAQADQRWGGQPEYEAYKAATGVLIPGVGKG